MLDAQRFKATNFREDVRFTRILLWSHIGLGITVMLLMLLHEIFGWAAGVAGWYLVTMVLTRGMRSASGPYRQMMGAAFLIFALFGIYFLGQVLPHLKPENAPLVSHAALPFWLGLTNIVYAAGGVLILTSLRVKKACSVYFSMW